MPAVERDERRNRLRVGVRRPHVERRAGVRTRVRTHAPRAPDVVLQPRAADRGQLGVAVAKDLHFAFAVPRAAVDRPNADRAPEEASRPAQPLGDDEVALHGRGVLASERHVQIRRVVAKLRLEREIDLEVQHDGAR